MHVTIDVLPCVHSHVTFECTHVKSNNDLQELQTTFSLQLLIRPQAYNGTLDHITLAVHKDNVNGYFTLKQRSR